MASIAEEPPLVIILDSDVHDVEENVLKGVATVKSYNAKSISDLPEDDLRNAKAVMLWHTLKVTKELLERLESCKIIVRIGVGYDNVDIKEASELTIFVSNVPNYGTEEVADSALSHILNLYRRTLWVADFVQKGGKAAGPSGIQKVAGGSKRIRGQVLGLIGFGRIGIATAQRAKAFGFEIQFYDPYIAEGFDKAVGVKRCLSLGDLLSTSDCISLHCDLNESSRNIINAYNLSLTKRGVFIVNTARGGCVNESELAAALASGQVGAAALDVHQVEPYGDQSPLWGAPNLICTPHTAYFSDESAIEIRRLAAEEVLRLLQQQRLRNCVNGNHIERVAWEKLMISTKDASSSDDDESARSGSPASPADKAKVEI